MNLELCKIVVPFVLIASIHANNSKTINSVKNGAVSKTQKLRNSIRIKKRLTTAYEIVSEYVEQRQILASKVIKARKQVLVLKLLFSEKLIPNELSQNDFI